MDSTTKPSLYPNSAPVEMQQTILELHGTLHVGLLSPLFSSHPNIYLSARALQTRAPSRPLGVPGYALSS